MVRNSYKILGKTVLIYLNRRNGGNMIAFVDKSDLSLLKQYDVRWYVMQDKSIKKVEKFYVMTTIDGKTVLLHRLLMGFPDELVVDHKNGNPLNNRRSNLRLLTQSQNALNRRGAELRSKSGVLGVHWSKARGKWRARVKQNGKTFYEKLFDDLAEAEKAVNEVREQLLKSTNNS
jgi:hypothetical protein